MSFQKWHEEFDKFWPKHSEVCKIRTSNGLLLTNICNVSAKEVQGRVIFHDTEEWCKIWRKAHLWFEKRYEEFGKVSPENWQESDLGLWWGPFVQIRKFISLKFTEVLYFMPMKNDAKFEGKLTCHFKIDMRNLTNFDPST